MTDREIILYGCNTIVFKAINKDDINYASFVSEAVKTIFVENDIDSLCDFIAGIYRFTLRHTNDLELVRAKNFALQFEDDIQQEYSNVVKSEGI